MLFFTHASIHIVSTSVTYCYQQLLFHTALSAMMSAFNSYVRQNAYHRNFKWTFKDLFCCHVIATQQRQIVEQSASEFRSLHLQAKERNKWTGSSSLHDTRTVNLTLVQCECHIGKQIVITRINSTNRNQTADFTFSRNLFLVPISRGRKYLFCAPHPPACGGPWLR